MAVVATGFFDGVHSGHREVIKTLVNEAHRRSDESLIITFWPHPRTVLQNGARTLRLLTSLEEKKEMLFSLGVDRVEVLPFSREFSRMTAKEYLRDVVAGRFGGKAVVLGYDNRMGSDQLTPEQASVTARSLGIDALPAGQVGGVSSTVIRKSLSEGLVEDAEAMLGYRYLLHGVVVSGKQLGRTIGFPTANMQQYEPLKLVPGRGVYFTEVDTLGGRYYGMTNVGDIVETHIFDFCEDIYGLDIKIKFVRRLRDGRKFKSLDELKDQLIIDEEACRALF